jgi:hypothetical protein
VIWSGKWNMKNKLGTRLRVAIEKKLVHIRKTYHEQCIGFDGFLGLLS